MSLLGILILIVLSGLFSASENSFFSISKQEMGEMASGKDKKELAVVEQLGKPKELLATILIANNFVNVSLVILSSLLFERSFQLTAPWDFIVQVVLVTFILLLFGEVIPKVYATQNNIQIAKFMAGPIKWVKRLLYPLVRLLVNSTNGINKRIKKVNQAVSIEEINHAIDITSDEAAPEEEKNILKGIANFGNISTSQVMKPRLDVVALDISIDFHQLLDIVREHGFSRLPVYKERKDKVEGMILVKDLLSHLDKPKDFEWQKLIKDVLIVPENKKIDDLMEEFRERKVHLAIVTDEWGGMEGIVTMEDILEEVFGEINDEFDSSSHLYSVLDEHTFIIKGTMMQNDVCKLLELPLSFFEEVKGDSDTISGLLQELAGKIPERGEEINVEHLRFVIESASKRKINRIKLMVHELEDGNE